MSPATERAHDSSIANTTASAAGTCRVQSGGYRGENPPVGLCPGGNSRDAANERTPHPPSFLRLSLFPEEP